MAVKDVYHELGRNHQRRRKKYEAHRLKMASAVWKKMKASDSRECRNCHNFEYMDFTLAGGARRFRGTPTCHRRRG